MGEYAVRACVWDRYISNKPAHIVCNIVPISTEQIVPLKLQLQLQELMQVQQCGLVSIPCMRKGGLTFGHNVTASWLIPQQ